ncbi:MAG: glycine cleavage system protein H [Desulfobacterota bacterium]|nr:glycine cleavage system protein H [Thermodesulfobacteriota bacterium]
MEKKIDSSRNIEGYSLIGKNELKCVWMTAGLLTYKLCKYNLECDKCPLDRELRNLSPTPALEEAASPRPPDPFLQVKPSLFYHPGHTWVKVESEREVRVGIDHFLAELMGEVKAVLFSLVHRRCHQGEPLCSIVQEEGILHVRSPISGSLLGVNPRLKDHPDLVRQKPLGEGYLLTLKPKNLQREQRNFLYGEAAHAWCRREWERFKTEILSESPSRPDPLGKTLQDGRISLREIKQALDPERYCLLIDTFLRKGERSPLER